MEFKEISLQMWMAIVLLGLGFILHIVSFASPQWNHQGSEAWGLWQRCTEEGCIGFDETYSLTNTMEVGRACQILGLVCFIVLIVVLVLYIVWRPDIRLLSTAVIVAFLTMFTILIGAVMWSSGANTSLSWGYYVCYFSALSVSASGGILIHERRQQRFIINNKQAATEDV